LATKEAARTKAEHDLREEQERLQRWNIELEQALNEKTAELRQSQGRLQALASELSLVEQRERKRLANELHDHLQQLLVLGKLIIGQGKRFASGVPDCEIVLKKVDDILSDALTYSRTLVTELSPPVLHDHGLAGGLRWLGDYMKKHGQTVTVMVPEDQDLKLPEDQVILLFQSVRELLINSSKHAGTSEATVRMDQRDDYLQIEVRDEGAGFDLAAAAAAAADTPNGGISSKFGLFSIQERMRALGASFAIHSVPDYGTTATMVLPLTRRVESSRPRPSNFGTDDARTTGS
jgi:signal transduction histidine kinase